MLVFTASEWKSVVTNSPFARKSGTEDSKSALKVAKKGKKGAVTVKTEYFTFLCSGEHNLCNMSLDEGLSSASGVNGSVSGRGAEAASRLAARVATVATELDPSTNDQCAVHLPGVIAYVPVVYIRAPRGCLESPFMAKSFVDKYSGVNATSRNLDTVLTLLSMVEEEHSA